MMKIKNFLLIIFLSIFLRGFEKDSSLISPLSFDTYCTSSFGEYRFNHFHGGVDFSTKTEEGHSVLAVGDGRISRVRREPAGYGRVLYLDLNDGRTAVYGHLIRFSRELGIEKRLKEECEKKGTSFPGDIYFSPPIEVKKGDVIAFSGELGIGSPHLHLEIRKGEELCDPFSEGISFEKYSVPSINSIYFVQNEEGARVNSSLFPQKISIAKNGEGKYLLKENVFVEGKAEIYIDVSDSMGSPTYKTFPCEIQGKIDGQEFFYINLKSVSLSHYKESPYLYDIIDGNVCLKMKKSDKIVLNEIRGDGIPALVGKHNLEITVKNRGGKIATLQGEIDYSDKRSELKSAIPSGKFKVIKSSLYNNGVGVTITPLLEEGASKIFINQNKASFFINRNERDYEVLIPKSALLKGAQEIKIGGEKIPGVFCKGEEQIVLGKYNVEIPENVLAKIENSQNSLAIDVSPKGLKPLVLLSAHKTEVAKEAIYAGDYLFSRLNSKPKNLFKAENYKILKDETPPIFGKIKVATIPNINEKELRVEIKDNLSGVDPYSIKVLIDGKMVYPDWDADASTIRVDLTNFTKGEHSVSVSLNDKMGNSSSLPKTKFFL
ncbi:MAG: M23 family metallopeptidase [Acidobacteria bacterium]|nr:M23 family metallopeptidase [Acidobacteriota bacterium]